MTDETPEPLTLDDPRTVCDHEDERGSTVMRVRDDRWACAVCGEPFRLVSALATPDATRARSVPDDRLRGAARKVDEAWDVRTNAYDITSYVALTSLDEMYQRLRALRAALASDATPSTGLDGLREAVNEAIATLDDIVDMVEYGGDIPTEITIVQNRLRAATPRATPATGTEELSVDRLALALKQADSTQGLNGYREWASDIAEKYAALSASPTETP